MLRSLVNAVAGGSTLSRGPRRKPRRTQGRRSPRVEALEDRRVLATLTVNSDADDGTGGLTLREAIEAVNTATLPTGGDAAQVDLSEAFGTNDTILFADSLFDTVGEATIQLTCITGRACSRIAA